MLTPVPPTSNNERQRQFQAAHPGYDRKRKARDRQSAQRGAAMLRAAREKAAQADALATQAEIVTIPIPTIRLALPAPVEPLILPALNDLDALLAKCSRQLPAVR